MFSHIIHSANASCQFRRTEQMCLSGILSASIMKYASLHGSYRISVGTTDWQKLQSNWPKTWEKLSQQNPADSFQDQGASRNETTLDARYVRHWCSSSALSNVFYLLPDSAYHRLSSAALSRASTKVPAINARTRANGQELFHPAILFCAGSLACA